MAKKYSGNTLGILAARKAMKTFDDKITRNIINCRLNRLERPLL